MIKTKVAFFSQSAFFENFLNCYGWLEKLVIQKAGPPKKPLLF